MHAYLIKYLDVLVPDGHLTHEANFAYCQAPYVQL